MPFPDLQPRPDTYRSPPKIQRLFAQATGVPDNGPNTFAIPFIGLGVAPWEVDPDKMKVFVEFSQVNPGVTGAQFVSMSPDKTQMTLNFVQTAPGTGEATVTVQIQHSMTR